MRAQTEPRSRAFSCYRLLLLAYPRSFRRKYGDEMARLFEDRYEQGHRNVSLAVGLWIGTLADVGRNAFLERVTFVGEARPRELAGAGSAAGASTLAGAAAYACICCVLPASFALAGGTALIATQDLLAIRPHLLFASLVLVTASLWTAYSTPGQRAPDCGSGSCSLARISAWTASFIWLVGWFAPWWAEALHQHAHFL